MSLETIVQSLVFGLFVGSSYGIAAVGLALVFGVLKVLNVAHGELIMLGGYAAFWLFALVGLDPFLALVPAALLMAGFGLALHRGLFRQVERLQGEAKLKQSLLVSFGLTLILQNLAIQLWTADERAIQTAYAGAGLSLFGIVLPYVRLANLGIALATILGLHLFLQRTYPGRAIRAVAEDWEAASLAGIDVPRIYGLTFALGAGLAAVAGTLLTVGFGVSLSVGLAWTLKALVVVVLAGTGSVMGAFPAGILLGLAEAVAGIAIAGAYRETVGLVIFLLVLLLRPQGLFGRA